MNNAVMVRLHNRLKDTDKSHADIVEALKNIGQTPYLYLRMAIIAYMDGSITQARLWVNYAYDIMNEYYSRLDELEVFDTIAEFILGAMIETEELEADGDEE